MSVTCSTSLTGQEGRLIINVLESGLMFVGLHTQSIKTHNFVRNLLRKTFYYVKCLLVWLG